MITFIEEKRSHLFSKIISSFVAITFIASIVFPPQYVQAQLIPQTAINLPIPGTMLSLTGGFVPSMLKGVIVDPENPLHFNFIMDLGEQELKGIEISEEGTKLIKYFLASLTVPDDEMWVNLSPYEEGRIISDGLGQTEMGRDLLSQDYLLKQLSSSLMYPEEELGGTFWKKIYSQAYEKYHTTDIPVDTFNKVWIVPDQATVYEHGTGAFVVERHLKVMLEEDYFAMTKSPYRVEGEQNSELVTKIIKEIIIPAIEKEINEGENFARLRQIYNSMILATWFKKSLQESLLGKVYVDQNKTMGVDVEDKEIKHKIYNQYVEAFKKGVYDYIREDYDPASQEIIPRKYFSGGMTNVQNLGVLPEDTALTSSQRVEAWVPGTDKVNLDVDLLEGNQTNVAAVANARQNAFMFPGVIQTTEEDDEKEDLALSTKATEEYLAIQRRFENLVENGHAMVRPAAKKFSQILDDKMTLVPFYMKLSGKTEEEIIRDILEYTYEPNVANLEGMNEHILKGEVNVKEARKIRTSESDPIVAVNLKEGETLNPLLWPLKGDPWQSGHIWMGYESLNKFALDLFIPTVDDSDPTRKPKLSSLMLRGPETDSAYELYGDLVKRENLMRDYPALLTADGERVLFTFLKINQHIRMNVHYGAGSDHANIYAAKKKVIAGKDFVELYKRYDVIKDQETKDKVTALLEEKGILSNGEFNESKIQDILDALRVHRYLSDDYKLYTKKDKEENKIVLRAYHKGENVSDLSLDALSGLGITEGILREFIYHVFFEPDVPTKIMFHMLENTEDFQDLENKQQVSIIFNQRIGEEVPTDDLKMYQDYVNERLARANKDLKPIELKTTSQPLDISSTEIRELGYHWKMPFNIAQIANAFEMWSFQTEEGQQAQVELGEQVFDQYVGSIINSKLFEHVENRNKALKMVTVALKDLNGFGLNEFDKLVASRLITLREGKWGQDYSPARKEHFYTWLNELREAAQTRAQELVEQGLKNPLPIRKKDQSILKSLIQDGEMAIPVGMVRYLEQFENTHGSLSVEGIVEDLGLTKPLVETIVAKYKADGERSLLSVVRDAQSVSVDVHYSAGSDHDLKKKQGEDPAMAVNLKTPLPSGQWKRSGTAVESDINPDMFRAYDYRNEGKPLTPDVVEAMGYYFADSALKKAKAAGITNRTVLIAKDARAIEPELEDALVTALSKAGLNVRFIAVDGPNAVTQYSGAVQLLKPLMGIFLTASHMSRPKEQPVRGMKVAQMLESLGAIISLSDVEIQKESKQAVYDFIRNPEKMDALNAEVPGTIKGLNIDKDIIRLNVLFAKVAFGNGSLYQLGEDLFNAETSQDAYAVLESWEAKYTDVEKPFEGLKIAIDGAHAGTGPIAKTIYEALGAEVSDVNMDIQWVEGEHNADPAVAENRKELQSLIEKVKADFGFTNDLDGDRLALLLPLLLKTSPEMQFELVEPDSLMELLLPSLMKEWGYGDVDTGIIRDVLGSSALNLKAEELGMTFDQTDAGYPHLKRKKAEREMEAKSKDGKIVYPIFGEKSGHIWTHFTGEIENPTATALLFSALVMQARNKAKEVKENEAYDILKEGTIPYVKSARVQPLFHPALLQVLSDADYNDTGWKFVNTQEGFKNPPSVLVKRGKDYTIRKLMEKFKVGTEFETNVGILTVQSFNTKKDDEAVGGLYQFADINFEKNGQFIGRVIFRASSNDPTFVSAFEAVAFEGTEIAWGYRNAAMKTVYDFLRTEKLALVTLEELTLLPLTEEAKQGVIKKFNLKILDKIYKEASGDAAMATQETKTIVTVDEVYKAYLAWSNTKKDDETVNEKIRNVLLEMKRQEILVQVDEGENSDTFRVVDTIAGFEYGDGVSDRQIVFFINYIARKVKEEQKDNAMSSQQQLAQSIIDYLSELHKAQGDRVYGRDLNRTASAIVEKTHASAREVRTLLLKILGEMTDKKIVASASEVGAISWADDFMIINDPSTFSLSARFFEAPQLPQTAIVKSAPEDYALSIRVEKDAVQEALNIYGKKMSSHHLTQGTMEDVLHILAQNLHTNVDAIRTRAIPMIQEMVDAPDSAFVFERMQILLKNPGGINLDPNLLDLTIKRDGHGVPLPVSEQILENIQIEGFIPVIINVTPITNLPLLLGMSESENPFASNTQQKDHKGKKEFSSNVSRDPMDLREDV